MVYIPRAAADNFIGSVRTILCGVIVPSCSPSMVGCAIAGFGAELGVWCCSIAVEFLCYILLI